MMTRPKVALAKGLVILVLTIVISMAIPTTFVLSDAPGNDAPSTAELFPASGTASGQLNSTSDPTDIYYKVLAGGEDLRLSITNGVSSSGNISVELSIPNSTVRVKATSLGPGQSKVLEFVTNSTQGGRLLINVSLASGTNASYSLAGAFAQQDDAGSGQDAPASSSQSISLAGERIAINGTVGPGDDKLGSDNNDMFNFQVQPHRDIIINGTSNRSKTDVWVELHQNTVKVLPYFRGLLTQDSPLGVRVYGGDAGGRFYLNADWENGARASYRIMVTIVETPDTVKPVLKVDAVPSTLSKGNITITGNLTDDRAVGRVEVSLNSAPAKACTGAATWRCDIALSKGVNILTITAYDKAGNSAATTVTVTYEPPVPQPLGIKVNITSPTTGSFEVQKEIHFSGMVNRTDGKVTVLCSPDGGATWTTGSVSGANWACGVVFKKKGETFVVKAMHDDGSVSQMSVSIVIKEPRPKSSLDLNDPAVVAVLVVMGVLIAIGVAVEIYSARREGRPKKPKAPRGKGDSEE